MCLTEQEVYDKFLKIVVATKGVVNSFIVETGEGDNPDNNFHKNKHDIANGTAFSFENCQDLCLSFPIFSMFNFSEKDNFRQINSTETNCYVLRIWEQVKCLDDDCSSGIRESRNNTFIRAKQLLRAIVNEFLQTPTDETHSHITIRDSVDWTESKLNIQRVDYHNDYVFVEVLLCIENCRCEDSIDFDYEYTPNVNNSYISKCCR